MRVRHCGAEGEQEERLAGRVMFTGVHKAKAVKEKIRRICEFGTAEQRESKREEKEYRI